jgi:hypothetical protein
MSTTPSEAPADTLPAQGQPLRNGATGPATEAPAQETPSSDSQPAPGTGKSAATTKAEEMVESAAVQIAVATSYIGKGFLRLVARCREELSDIWAEAQDLRRGDKSGT